MSVPDENLNSRWLQYLLPRIKILFEEYEEIEEVTIYDVKMGLDEMILTANFDIIITYKPSLLFLSIGNLDDNFPFWMSIRYQTQSFIYLI